LNELVLADILWSMWKTVECAIREHLGRAVNADEAMRIASLIERTVLKLLVQLWIETARNSKLGTSRAGNVVARIRRDEERRKQQLASIKKLGADAKYMTHQKIELNPSEHSKDIQKLRMFLQSKLELRASVQQSA